MQPEVEPIPHGAISATNVRPAFEASLAFGATEAELERATGLTRALLADDAAIVDGAATYAHMELMFDKPRFAQFVVAAASAHTLRTLGVVGLACKTVATVGEAMAYHSRFQHLTNRTARYETIGRGDHIEIREERFESERIGSVLISDYTMLVAVQLVRASAATDVAPLRMLSRRREMPAAEREVYERFVGAPVEIGAGAAALMYPLDLVSAPISTADPELADYFAQLLDRASRFGAEQEPGLLRDARVAIRDELLRGPPTTAAVARRLGVGARTLQRRLSEHDVTFASLLETTRQQLADGYLADDELSLVEVAYLLGYKEQSSFHRAFRRWHGTTPAARRRELQASS